MFEIIAPPPVSHEVIEIDGLVRETTTAVASEDEDGDGDGGAVVFFSLFSLFLSLLLMAESAFKLNSG